MATAVLLSKGRYRARLAQSAEDISAAQALRTQAFGTQQLDCDAFDGRCCHVLVEDMRTDARIVCCFRMMRMDHGREVGRSYSAQFYDLSSLEGFNGRMVEMGRFCIHPDCSDPDILRVAWGAMTAYVDQNGVEIYRDRAPEDWPRDKDGGLAMVNARLDLEALLAEAD